MTDKSWLVAFAITSFLVMLLNLYCMLSDDKEYNQHVHFHCTPSSDEPRFRMELVPDEDI